MLSPAEKRKNLVITLLCAVIAACAATAFAVLAVPRIIDSWQEDVGYTDEQLDDVERLCEAELKDLEGSASYDRKFERCEADEKHRINPDPFGFAPGRPLEA